MLKGKSVAATTLGCKVNQAETDSMLDMLSAAGADIVDFEEKADIYIVNTCSVTNIADKKSRQMLHRQKEKPGVDSDSSWLLCTICKGTA